VVIQQNSRKLLIMDILMSETCWAHKRWNKTTSAIKLVFYSLAITMMHGQINIRLTERSLELQNNNCLPFLGIWLCHIPLLPSQLEGRSYIELNPNCVYADTKKGCVILLFLVAICLKFLYQKSLLHLFLNCKIFVFSDPFFSFQKNNI